MVGGGLRRRNIETQARARHQKKSETGDACAGRLAKFENRPNQLANRLA